MIMFIRSVFTYYVILTCFSLDGNLAHNATRPSLLNEAFFYEIMHFLVFMMSFHFLCK